MNGNVGCPCIDASAAVSSLEARACQTPEYQGVMLGTVGTCAPFMYGSNECLPYDQLYDPACNADGSPVPAYCARSWCYVDLETCKVESSELVYRSEFFNSNIGMGADLFYSYSTCNSTADDWLDHIDVNKEPITVLNGVSITATVPTFIHPYLYKRDPKTGNLLHSAGKEYYNNSIAYEGVYINFLNNIVKLSAGDIKELNYTHRSKGSDTEHPSSSYTASVRDVQAGLSDMAVGPFWVTAQRLRMTAFTVPFLYDKTVLVIKRPSENTSLKYQTSKVLQPFTPGLWYLVMLTIFVSALLSVWFSDPPSSKPNLKSRRRILAESKTRERVSPFNLKDETGRRRAIVYVHLAIDALLEKGMFFFGASVEQDKGASLPHKLLMFGFAFFILISISSYVANLAAFLTLSGVSNYIGTMEAAIAYKKIICAHPALRDELQVRWPDANFVFSESGTEFYGVLDLFDAGKCDAMAVGREDTTLDEKLMEMYCERDLVFTDALVIEIPMAFPISPDITAGFSYWLYQGEKYHDISLTNAKRDYSLSLTCDVELSAEEESAQDYAQITAENMMFPFIIFITFASTAIIMQLIRRQKESIFGRVSSLNLYSEHKASNNALRSMVTVDDCERHTVADCEIEQGTLGEVVETDDTMSTPASRKVAFAMESTPIVQNDHRLQRLLDDFIGYVEEIKRNKTE